MLAAAPWSAMRRGRTRASGRRASSAAATAAASALAAQTTTDGPEPESVTPSVPGTGSLAQLLEQRRVLDAVRLVQAVVEGGREQRRRRPAAIAAPSSAAWALAAAASSCETDSGRRERDCFVFTRVSGTTTIGASGRSVASRCACACPLPLRQIRQTPPRTAAARLSACPSSGRPSSSTSSGDAFAVRRRRARRRGRRRSSPRTSRARARAGCG